jgi:hypothetical protein
VKFEPQQPLVLVLGDVAAMGVGLTRILSRDAAWTFTTVASTTSAGHLERVS